MVVEAQEQVAVAVNLVLAKNWEQELAYLEQSDLRHGRILVSALPSFLDQARILEWLGLAAEAVAGIPMAVAFLGPARVLC